MDSRERVGVDAPMPRGRLLAPAVLFGLWFLAFMLLESFVNSRAGDVLGVE